jgi:hypothetical protein
MDTENLFRRLRGAVGNAVVWGAGWATLGFAVFATLKVAGILPAEASWLDAVTLAAKLGIIGGVAGTAFSAVVGLLYRGRRLSDISAVRFGAGGALMAGLFVPAFFQVMNLLTGDGLVPMGLVLDDILWAMAFGGIAAGASLTLAQRADTLLPGSSQDRSNLLGSGDLLAAADDRRPGRPDAFAWRGAED